MVAEEKLGEYIVDDGFGAVEPAVCPECGCRAVRIYQPGYIRCSFCYGGNSKEHYTSSNAKE